MARCIKRRWNDLDKKAFLAAYVLDPNMYLNGIRISWFFLSRTLADLYKRFFRKEAESIIVELVAYKAMEKERNQLKSNPNVFWEFAKDTLPELSKLALLLLNIHPQGAGLERVFSASGIYHSNRRNRLSHEKVVKMVRLKADILSKNPRPTRSHSSKSLPLGDIDEQQGDSSDDDEAELVEVLDDLNEDASEDEIELESGTIIVNLPQNANQSSTNTTDESLEIDIIADLSFNWSTFDVIAANKM